MSKPDNTNSERHQFLHAGPLDAPFERFAVAWRTPAATLRGHRDAARRCLARCDRKRIGSSQYGYLDPYAYLRHVFTYPPRARTVEDIEALLPWHVPRESPIL